MSTSMDTETRLFHETLIRLFKGMVRAYERWVNVRSGKEPPAIELPGGDRSGNNH